MKLTGDNTRLQRAYLWLLRKGPRIVAHWIACRAEKLQHDEGTSCCWPCEARKRLQRDAHNSTIGPLANIYCDKCGLEKSEWRKWCSNRVEKVNNKPAKRPRYFSIGWDE